MKAPIFLYTYLILLVLFVEQAVLWPLKLCIFLSKLNCPLVVVTLILQLYATSSCYLAAWGS